ncbi:prepilin-type N-terminal cleavage/methylation domain-containing protein [Bhargavaea ginsengi]|uniref:prepilin-type N-terminal cleavage/methylation domain-containing protein n=1 Tax=Bhargavaea ginsengi TaxID=426757 RepID=UPI00203E646E|nr:prepilin-type N-terminal cleavage/methylation domain-containing protein [Bhargavaea ginsengi]MCM3086595.1 prepilin-type N-terminal cleavage/methylation domain-containing protein [Bhargavaea ginsengi]
MNTRAIKNNQQGLTLVEILATLVIIGIVFIGIMAIFPQMTLFNERTEVKLDAMNIARNEMSLLRQLEPARFDPSAIDAFGDLNTQVFDLNTGSGLGGEVTLSYQIPGGYFIRADIYPADPDEQFGNINLHKVHLQVSEGNPDRKISETYGYLRIPEPESGSS